MKKKDQPENRRRPYRLAATGIFLAAWAGVNSLLWLYLAPFMFPMVFLFHLPQSLVFLVAALIVPGVSTLSKRRFFWSAAVAGVLTGSFDLVADFRIASIPELARSPYRPILRGLVSTIAALLISWLYLHLTVFMKERALNKSVDHYVSPGADAG